MKAIMNYRPLPERVSGIILMFLVLLAVSFNNCGGGGGGTAQQQAPLPDGTFNRTVELDSSVQSWYVTLHDTIISGGSSMRAQHLYRAGDIDGSGHIDSLAFRYDSDQAAEVTCPHMTVKMGHTSLGDLTMVFADNAQEGRGTLITVVDDSTIVIPPGSSRNYFEIPLETKFPYNGVDNLVVDVTRGALCSASVDILTTLSSTAYSATAVHPADSSGTPAQQLNQYLPDTKFHFTGGATRLEYGGSLSAPVSAPFTNSSCCQKVQSLHFAADLDGSGLITGVAFKVGAQTFTPQTYTFTMRLGHTSLSGLTTDFNANFNTGAPVTVAETVDYTVPANLPPGTYVWIPLPDSTFTYNGIDNLIVEIDVTSATGNTSWYQGSDVSGPTVRAWGNSGSNTALGVNNMHYHTLFRFKGDTMTLNTPNGMSGATGETFPFNVSDGKIQFLYLAPELGTKGNITKFACRAFQDSVIGLYDYTVTMSHSGATGLTVTFGDNLPDPVIVFDGYYSIPAGLLRGDWLDMPLSTPFPYNGKDNLVVEISGIGGNSNVCVVDTSSGSRYTGRRVSGISSDTTGNAADNYMIDARFTL